LPGITTNPNEYGDYNYYNYSSNDYCPTWNTTSHNYHTNNHGILEDHQQPTNHHAKGTRRFRRSPKPWRA
jgi:hypothetical protein